MATARTLNQQQVGTTTRYQPLVVVLVCFALGIAWDRHASWHACGWWLLALASWCAWLCLHCLRRDRAACLCLFACLSACGSAWHHTRWNWFPDDDLGAFARRETEPACIRAVATTGPRRVAQANFDPLRAGASGERSRLEIWITGIRDADRWLGASGPARLEIDGHLLGILPGDQLQVFVQLSAVGHPDNPGEFDFANHLRADRQRCRLRADFPECVSLLERGSRLNAARWIEQLRGHANAQLWPRLHRERSGLAAALLLGVREEMDQESSEAYFETGTVHLLSISGLHVGILAAALFWTMRLGLLRRRMALASVALITLSYAIVIDAEPPAVRATVLVLLTCLGLWLGRSRSAFNILAASGLVVLINNPGDLFRAGPQLSFLSAAALSWFGPRLARESRLDPLRRLIAQTRPWPIRAARWIVRTTWQATWLSTCIWAVTAPLVLGHFHIISPVTLVLTPLLALPVAIGLVTGFGLVALGWLLPPLGNLCAWLCDHCLAILELGVNAGRSWPGSHYWLPGPDAWWLYVFYLLLTFWAANAGWRPARRWCLAILATWATVGLTVGILRAQPRSELACNFLSVGHGCAIVIELPDGQTLLYDAGRLGSPTAAARSVSSFLWSRGKTHLDAVILSHADVDHFNALPDLLTKFSVGVVYVTPAMIADRGPALEFLRDSITAAGVPLREIWSGDQLKVGAACRMEVLHPPRRGVLGSDNANSLVLAIEYQGRRILLAGDLESPGLDDLLSEEPTHCDVVLAPHHGSTQSNPPGFAAWATPDVVVISGRLAPETAAVRAAFETQDARVLHTAELGTITARIGPRTMSVSTFREQAAPGSGGDRGAEIPR